MEEFLKENIELRALQKVFQMYSNDINKDKISREALFQLFFDYQLLDVHNISIFDLNIILHQLGIFKGDIKIEDFFRIIIYIYKKEDDALTEISDITVNTIASIYIEQEKKKPQKQTSIINMIKNKYENHQFYFYFMTPDLSYQPLIDIINYNHLKYIEEYSKSIRDNIFMKYIDKIPFEENINTDIDFINIKTLRKFLAEFNIFNNFDALKLGQIFQYFFNNLNEGKNLNELANISELKKKGFILAEKVSITQSAEDFKAFCGFFEEEAKSNKEMGEIFVRFYCDIKYINFNFSCFVLMLALCALNLKSTEGLTFEEQISFFFENILKIQKDNYIDPNTLKENEDDKDIEVENIPECETLKQAKKREINSTEDEKFISELLKFLNTDNLLPPPDDNVLQFMNDQESHVDKYFFYSHQAKPAKFPVEELMVEREERQEKIEAQKEEEQIRKAKKPDKGKDKNQSTLKVERDTTTESQNDLKYLGKQNKVESLANRLVKNTFKEILPNSNVYPSIIKEVLMIPKKITDKALEVIVESLQDQVEGHLEKAINRLEKSKEYLNKGINEYAQVDLFYVLSFGALYESLDFDLVALKYFFEALNINKKLMPIDPDTALVFSFLGEIFLKEKEYIWALRCYQKAKDIRESTLGGDSLDTAAVYNNLGVVCYMLQSYMPANGFFKLAYEIYREYCGQTHPRTILIKSNISKMSHLEYNKKVEFKTLSLIPTLEVTIKNPKKSK